MSNLHRAQLYIDENQIQLLKLEAEREDLTVSELVRRAIERFLISKAKSVDWNRDPLNKALGKIKLEVTDASLDHDHYLYGRRKRS